jgi:predicted site-specific integrase-resolvase
MLGISKNLAYRMASLGQLPVIRCGERRMVVPLSALRRMLNEENNRKGDEV